MDDLRGKPFPRDAAELVRLLRGGLAPLVDEIRALRARVHDLESRGIKYCGTWQKALDYKRGDVVTHAGSAWVALAEQTRAEPGATGGWQLMVKAGRDAR